MIIFGFFIGLVIFIAILTISHHTQKSYKELIKLNRNIEVLIEEFRGLNHPDQEQKHTPFPKIKT